MHDEHLRRRRWCRRRRDGRRLQLLDPRAARRELFRRQRFLELLASSFSSVAGALAPHTRLHPARPVVTLDEATARLRERFPHFPVAMAEHLALHGTRPENGGRVWKFDPLHQTSSPQPYSVVQAEAFWQRVTCPALYIEGAESPLHLDTSEVERRMAALRATRASIPGAGHHPHLEQPEAFSEVLIAFLREPGPSQRR